MENVSHKDVRKKLDSLRKVILSKAKIKKGTSTDNIKLGKMGSWAMLFGDCEWYIPELDVTVKGTCGEHCRGCFNPLNPKCSACYVAKSYIRYTKRNADGSVGDIQCNKCSVKLGHAYRTIAMTMFRNDLLLSLDKQLSKMKKKLNVVRINESGELTCYEDLVMWCELASRHPETTFYLYTKNYKVVRKSLINNKVPANLWINISIWHEYGIEEYLEMCSHPQIRAFVLVDTEWTREKYYSKGIEITSMCGAYDANGKMNHAVTCDKCKKCFGCSSRCVGCYEH